MKRRLFTILSTLSLLLFAATIALWFRSHRTHDAILYRTTERYWHLASFRGQLWLSAHEPRHRLTGKGYTSYSMSMGPGPTQNSEDLAAAAYEREPDLPRLHVDHYPALPPDQEMEVALDEYQISHRITSETESLLVGMRGVLRIKGITDESVVRRTERGYVESMEQQMRAWARLQAAVAPANRGRSFLAFHWHAGDGPGGAVPAPSFALPYWPFLLLTAVVPTLHLLLIQRARRRTRLSRCANCNYDLRATPDRCPECGAIPRKHIPPKPRRLPILAAVSLLLCAAFALLWFRSHRTHHLILFPAFDRVWQISSLHGSLCLIMHRDTNIRPISRIHRYPLAPDIETERRLAHRRILRARSDHFAAEDEYAAIKARLQAGEPPTIRPRLNAALQNCVNTLEEQSTALARSHATNAVTKARAHAGLHYHPGDPQTPLALTLPWWPFLLLTVLIPTTHLLLIHRTRRRAQSPPLPPMQL